MAFEGYQFMHNEGFTSGPIPGYSIKRCENAEETSLHSRQEYAIAVSNDCLCGFLPQNRSPKIIVSKPNEI